MPINIKQRLEMRKRPIKTRIMYQEWRHLLFLHWKYDKEKIQKNLPEGLHVDTFEDNAYITIVPFFIQNLRIGKLPSLPFLSNFIEVNVRTYVYDRNGNPGIWFYSLDINSIMATTFARHFFSLPYQNAKLVSKIANNEISISGQRKNQVTMNFNFFPELNTESFTAEPNSLDFFLLERYALFSFKNNQLYIERIHHSPYLLSPVELKEYKSNLLEIKCLQTNSPFSKIHYCSGFDVDFFPLEKLYNN